MSDLWYVRTSKREKRSTPIPKSLLTHKREQLCLFWFRTPFISNPIEYAIMFIVLSGSVKSVWVIIVTRTLLMI